MKVWMSGKVLVLVNLIGTLQDRWPIILILLLAVAAVTPVGSRLLRQVTNWLRYRPVSQTNRIAVLLSVFITLVKWPFSIKPLSPGLDPSWIIGLNWATQKHALWGHDIVFTYGPMYWLLYPTLALSRPILITAFALSLFMFGYAVYVILSYLFAATSKAHLPAGLTILSVLIILLTDYNPFDCILIAVILLVGTVSRDYPKPQTLHVLMAVALLAVAALCKFSYLAIALTLLGFYTVLHVYLRNYWHSAAVWAVFVGVTLAAWLLTGQEFTYLPTYLREGVQLSQGYSEAMSYPLWTGTNPVPRRYFIYFLLAVGSLVGLGLLFLGAALKRNKSWFGVLLFAPVLFLAFKEGFVRIDRVHYVQFFAQVIMIAVGLVALFGKNGRVPTYGQVLALCSFFVCLPLLEATKWPGGNRLSVLVDEKSRLSALEQERSTLRKHYNLSESFVKRVTGASVDIIPYEIALLYGYNKNWLPRPVIQSYAAFTPELDRLNNAHYNTASGPEQVVYSYLSIDDRYPLFDEPTLFRTLLSHYVLQDSLFNKNIALFRRASLAQTTQNQSSLNQMHRLNSAIPIPLRTNCYTYLKAEVHLTVLGKLANFLCNVPALTMRIYTRDAKTPVRIRLLRQTSGEGLLISSYARNIRDVAKLFSGRAIPNVAQVVIEGSTYFYEQTIKTRFDFQTKPTSSPSTQTVTRR